MFKSYLKTTFRFLVKNKTFSFINIIGLSFGTLCCLYIVLYVADQFNYDKHHHNANDIYRITTTLTVQGDHHTNATSSPPIAPTMKNDFPEVQQFTRVVPAIGLSRHLLKYKEKSFYEKDLMYVDSTFFDVFTYHFTNGQSNGALNEPNTVVLMKNTADKLFGNEDPVGKVITLDNFYGKHDLKVTGVVDESLGKSHIYANLFVTMNSGGMGEYVRTNTMWSGNNFANSYVKIVPGANAAALESKLPAFLNKYGAQQLKTLGMLKVLHLQPVTSIHTTSGYEVELGKIVSKSFLYILLLIAALIQVIACINFMNLSTARASKRAKEVGVRKVVGAGKAALMKQFLGESFLLCLIGVIIALPLLSMVLPLLNGITKADIHLTLLADYRLWIVLAGLVFFTGLIAGSYPAFYLSAFQAIKVMKGNFSNQVSAIGIRRALVVFQFVLSVVLIAGIIVIYSQLNYIKNKDIGYEPKQKLVFSFFTGDTQDKMAAFANDINQLSEVKSVSKAENYLSQFVFNDQGVYLEGGNMASAIDAQNITVDDHFIQTNGIKIVSGRDFRLNDSGRILINEILAKKLGLNINSAPGTKVYHQFATDPNDSYEIVGVMKDFNISSLHSEVKPFMFFYSNKQGDFIHMIASTESKDYKSLLSKIESIWHKDLPSTPFEYKFLDEEVQQQYESEEVLSNIINSFTLMAIIISCLGLFGLTAFSAEQRSKEIGIRKVLGASVTGVATLLSKDFLKLILIAIVIAIPLSYWAATKWLESFVFRTPLSWWMFALAGILAILIAILTVSFQAIKAAMINPVKSLRSE